MTFAALLVGLAVLSCLLVTWQFVVASRFPLHRRAAAAPAGPAPGVSILKPLNGCDSETEACLRSWLTQEYPGPVEVLFGVSAESDPVCAIVRHLMATHPGCPAQLVVCRPHVGPNAKVSKLACLERMARYERIAVSDADVWAPPDFLAQANATLTRTGAALVNAFYQLAQPVGWAMRCEAFAVNADFWGQVLQARSLGPMRFALGAAMVLRREPLEAMGGFRALANFLADDYQLGRGLAQAGGLVELATVTVECRCASQTMGEVWAHQLRWSRTIRACRPAGYFFSLLNNATLWPALWMALHPTSTSLLVGAGLLGWRMLQGFLLERRMTGRADAASGVLALMKDILQIGLWSAAFLGSRVDWGGNQLRVGAEGRLLDGGSKLETRPPEVGIEPHRP